MKRLALWLFLPIGLLLITAGSVLLFGWARSSDTEQTETASSPPSTGPPPSMAPGPPSGTPTDVLVRQLQGFVERERGLTFKAPVRVSLLDDAAFRAKVLEIDDEDREEIEKAEQVLRAMGLLGRNVDLLKAVQDLAGAGVLGLYDPETDELVVRGGSITPGVRVTLVHELTHALEDQHFDLNRQDLGDEADYGFTSLVEGSALRVEEAYRRTLSPVERAQARREEDRLAGDVPEDLPPVVGIAFTFPYLEGPELVSAVLRAGGNARLNAAFAKPPLSTEHVLDPRRYLDGDEPKAVPVPKADGAAFDDGEIGELFLRLMLNAELSLDAARTAAQGWGGDRYVAWRDGARTCVRMDFVMDSQLDNDQLAEGLRNWAARREGAASATGTSVTTCG